MSDETKCKSCGQELPPNMTPVQKIGVVKWVKPDRKEAAVVVGDELFRVWAIWCPTIEAVALQEGDRVELTVKPDKYSPNVIRVALPAQALVEAEPV